MSAKVLRDKKRVMSLLLALTISINLCGCSSKGDKDKANSDFAKMIATIKPLYDIPDLYFTEEELSKILEVAETTKNCRSTNSDYSNLAHEIIKTSLLYSDDTNRVFIDDKDLPLYDNATIERDMIMRLSLKRAIIEMFDTSSNVPEDICRLKNLAVLNQNLQKEINEENSIYTTLEFAMYNPNDNTLIVDYDALVRGYNELIKDGNHNDLTFIDFIVLNIRHELDHARSYICDCRMEAGQEYDSISYKQTLMAIKEASAESQIYANDLDILKSNRDLFVYEAERYQEALLLLLAVFKENRDINGYYKAINDTDLKALYDYFGLFSKEQIESFYKIIKTMDGITTNNAIGYFLNSKGYLTSREKEKVLGYTYKLDILKSNLTDLVSYQMQKGDLSIEEIIFLYSFVKGYVVTGTFEEVGNETVYFVYDEDFLKDFLAMEESFYQFICTYYGVDISTIDSIIEKDIPVYYNEFLVCKGEFFERLRNRFPLIEFIFVSVPINFKSVKEYAEDAKEILARK